MNLKEFSNKVKNLKKEMNVGLIEREEQINLAILALLTKENLIIFGPPGTAKSEVSRRVARAFKSEYFEYLLTKFTTPEELFGPVSIKELEKDIFMRRTGGYLPTANIVFLDEIFKASSSILNTLLTILNEKLYHNGNIVERVDLYSIISATNELPQNEDGLAALYDRFLLRTRVDYVKDSKKLLNTNFLEGNFVPKKAITTEEVEEIQKQKYDVQLTPEISEYLLDIKAKITSEIADKDNHLHTISDRRLVKSLDFLKVAALSNNRLSLDISDLILLKNCFWLDEKIEKEIEAGIKEKILTGNKQSLSEYEEVIIAWQEEFYKVFSTEKKNASGETLYLDANGELTTAERGELPILDKYGDQIYYTGHKDYIKVLKELGKFDHGYIDTGLITSDERNIWIYEFSSTKVDTNRNKLGAEAKLLSLPGEYKVATIDSSEEFKAAFENFDSDVQSKVEAIYDNLIVEVREVEDLSKYFEMLGELISIENNIWLTEEVIIDYQNEIRKNSSKVKLLLDTSENILTKIKNIIGG